MAKSLSKQNMLVVFALDSEERGLFDGMNLVYSGVGKVNAAYRLTRALDAWRSKHSTAPDLVLNLGSAGSTHFKTGTLVNCTSFMQRDFDVTALGHDAYVTPFENIPAVLQSGQRYEAYPEGICGTGDSFVADGKKTPWNVVEMEAYALAKICMLEAIPFGCIKYITDGADGDAGDVWEKRLEDASKALRQAADMVLDAC